MEVGLTATGAPSSTFTASAAGGVLTLHDPYTIQQGGTRFGVAGDLSQSFTDVRVAAILNANHNANGNAAGVSARADLSTVTSYNAGVDFTNDFLFITKVVGGRNVAQAGYLTTPNASVPGTIATTPLTLTLDIVGDHLTASVTNGLGGPALATVQMTDASLGGVPALTSGVAGVFAQPSGLSENPPDLNRGTVNFAFDDISAQALSGGGPTAVPLPSPVIPGLATLSVTGLLVARRRRVIASR